MSRISMVEGGIAYASRQVSVLLGFAFMAGTFVSAAHAQDAQSEAGEPRAQIPAPEAAVPSRTSAAPKPHSLPTSKASPSKDNPAPATATKGGADRLDLGTATVTGDREQPKVMYVVPWKRSDIGDLSGKPMNSLLDEVLAPVDREEFKREVVYYQAVKEDASQNGASTPAAKQGEK